MGTRLFIGNLSYNVTEQELREAFTGEQIELRSVRVALDRETGRPRGFAFVETATDDGAKASIEKLSGRILQGRPIIVEEAQAKPAGPRPAGGFGGRPAPARGGGGSALGRRELGQAARRAVLGGQVVSAEPSARRRSRRSTPRLRSAACSGRFQARGLRRGTGSARPSEGPPRRERPEKKRSTRPKPEERERGNWRWDGKDDE